MNKRTAWKVISICVWKKGSTDLQFSLMERRDETVLIVLLLSTITLAYPWYLHLTLDTSYNCQIMTDQSWIQYYLCWTSEGKEKQTKWKEEAKVNMKSRKNNSNNCALRLFCRQRSILDRSSSSYTVHFPLLWIIHCIVCLIPPSLPPILGSALLTPSQPCSEHECRM